MAKRKTNKSAKTKTGKKNKDAQQKSMSWGADSHNPFRIDKVRTLI